MTFNVTELGLGQKMHDPISERPIISRKMKAQDLVGLVDIT